MSTVDSSPERGEAVVPVAATTNSNKRGKAPPSTVIVTPPTASDEKETVLESWRTDEFRAVQVRSSNLTSTNFNLNRLPSQFARYSTGRPAPVNGTVPVLFKLLVSVGTGTMHRMPILRIFVHWPV
jgi:hypothetical protein